MTDKITKRQKQLNDKYLEEAFKMLLDGGSETAVKMQLFELSQKDKTTLDEITSIYNQSKRLLQSEYNREKDFVIASHVQRYNREIKRLFSIDVSDFNKWKAIEVKTNAYFNLLEVLQQKERVLGLHSKSIHIKINNNIEVKETKIKPNFRLDALTFQEKIELLHLLEESEINREDMSIIPNEENEELNKNTIDIQHEEIKEELTLNVTEIKQDNLEEREEYKEEMLKREEEDQRKMELERARGQDKSLMLLQQNLLRAALKNK